MNTLVVYDSVYGNTRAVAHAIAGANPADVPVRHIDEVNRVDLDGADLLILGSPTYGSMPTEAVQGFLQRIGPPAREAAVVARKDHDGESRLLAYVVPSADPPPSDAELSSFLNKRLPAYMVPSAMFLLDEFPLTANGKLDRRALPEPDHSRQNLKAEFVAPRSAVEKTLADIWADVLGLDRVGVHDNFFELGGASIKSLRIVAKAETAGLSIDSAALSPELLFEHPTVAEIAELIESAGGEN